ELIASLLAPIDAMGGIFDLVEGVADVLGELVAPGLEQFAGAIEDGDAGIGRAGGDVNAVFGVDDDSAAVAIFHSLGELAPVLDQLIGMVAGAEANRGVGFGGRDQAGEGEPGGGGSGAGDKITTGDAVGKKIIALHKVSRLLGKWFTSTSRRCRVESKVGAADRRTGPGRRPWREVNWLAAGASSPLFAS